MTNTASTFLWFAKDGEAAVDFYVALFPGARLLSKQPMGPDGMMIATFELGGQHFTAMNTPHRHAFTDAISIQFTCRDQAEIDHLWAALAKGGTELQCGWLRDRFGLTWQIIPQAMGRLMGGGTAAQSQAVMAAMRLMVKIDLAAMQAAFDGAA